MRFRGNRGKRNSQAGQKHVREGIYIKRILKQMSPMNKISLRTVQVITSLVRDTVSKIVVEAFHLLSLSGKRTLSARDIQIAVRLHFPGELAKHAVSEGLKRVAAASFGRRFDKKEEKEDTKPTLSTTIIPSSYVKSNVKKMNYNYRISKTSMIYLAAVIEYILSEILELASNNAKASKRTLLIPQDVKNSIHNDDELDKMFGKVIIAGSGVVPFIHPYFSKSLAAKAPAQFY